jgi:VanZ family protein
MRRRLVRRARERLHARSGGKELLYRAPLLVLWMGVIYWLSAQPSLPHAPDPWWDLLLKKGAHVLVYVVLAVLWWWTLSAISAARKALVLAALFSVVYAVSDEVHQLYVPGRSGRLWDVGIDLCGVAIGLCAAWFCRRGD